MKKVFVIIIIGIAVCCYTAINTQKQNVIPIKIGIIDSNISSDYSQYFEVVNRARFTTNNDVSEHGVMTLGIIRKENETAQIYYAETFGYDNKGNIEDVIEALYWCCDNKVDIINMSFATLKDDPNLKVAIEFALKKGVVIVAACHNYYDGPSYPGMYKGVISVSEDNILDAVVNIKKQDYFISSIDGGKLYAKGNSESAAYITGKISSLLHNKSKSDAINDIVSKYPYRR